jgi:DNA-binding GntR family transcriptional regulator
MPQAQVEHKKIIEACKHGDAEYASTLMYSHVNNVGDALVEHVRRQEE